MSSISCLGHDSGVFASDGNHNRCVVLPGNVSLVADSLERRNQTWAVRADVANDLNIRVGDSTFQLHKIPMVSRSVYLNRLVFQRSNKNGERDNVRKIQIDNFPGGAETFELVVKFCYGWKIELTATNIAPVYSAAHFLEMSDDFEQGNLISKSEAFLSFVLFSSWKDIFQVLKSCEIISSWANELHIVNRCSEAIAWKTCIDTEAFHLDSDDALCHLRKKDNKESSKHKGIPENWWFEDVSVLRIDHFIEVIESIKSNGMRSELVGSCITHWTAKWLSQIPFRLNNLPKVMTQKLLGASADCLIKVLPEEENSVSCSFLLHLLKLGMMTRVNLDLLSKLEKRIAHMLDKFSVSEMLVKNYISDGTVYDVGIIVRVVETYVSLLKSPETRMFSIAKLVDGYLSLVATDDKLSVQQFKSLAESLPKTARKCDDGLYSAIDTYLKAHPRLSEVEKSSVCDVMDYHKLSLAARQHAMKNDRLSLNMSTRIILLEQVKMTRSMTGTGSNYRRTNGQAILRTRKVPEREWMTSQKEIRNMRKEVENMKLQLNEIQICKMQLQRQIKNSAFLFPFSKQR